MSLRDYNARVASNLKRYRKKYRLSLQAVATASGLSKTHVWEIEKGRGNPTVSTLDALGTALGVTLLDFLR